MTCPYRCHPDYYLHNKLKTVSSLCHFVAFVLTLWIVAPVAQAQSLHEHLSLDENWKFHLGDDWPDAISFMNSGTGSGPASEHFSDTFWRTVNLPHDWAVELPFDWAADGSHGFHTIGVK